MGKHEDTPKNTKKMAPRMVPAPGGSLGPLLESTLFLDTCFHRFWLPSGLHFGSLLGSILEHFLMNFLNALQEGSWVVLGRILEPTGLHFGAFLGPFSGSWDIAKIVKNL